MRFRASPSAAAGISRGRFAPNWGIRLAALDRLASTPPLTRTEASASLTSSVLLRPARATGAQRLRPADHFFFLALTHFFSGFLPFFLIFFSLKPFLHLGFFVATGGAAVCGGVTTGGGVTSV